MKTIAILTLFQRTLKEIIGKKRSKNKPTECTLLPAADAAAADPPFPPPVDVDVDVELELDAGCKGGYGY